MQTFLYVSFIDFLIAMQKDIEVVKVHSLLKRCPQCKCLSLEFDVKIGVIKCTKCGFEQRLKMMKQ